MTSPHERFRGLLAGVGVTIDPKIMSTIARSGSLASRMTVVSTVQDAVQLYEDALLGCVTGATH